MKAVLSLTLTSETNVNATPVGKPVTKQATAIQSMGFDLLVPADKFRQLFYQLIATGLNSLLDKVFTELEDKEKELASIYQVEQAKEAEEKAKAKAKAEAEVKAKENKPKGA